MERKYTTIMLAMAIAMIPTIVYIKHARSGYDDNCVTSSNS